MTILEELQKARDYIDDLQQQLDELKCGHKIVMPFSREHAEQMIACASAYLESRDETERNARGIPADPHVTSDDQ